MAMSVNAKIYENDSYFTYIGDSVTYGTTGLLIYADSTRYNFNGSYKSFCMYVYYIENFEGDEEVCSLLDFLYCYTNENKTREPGTAFANINGSKNDVIIGQRKVDEGWSNFTGVVIGGLWWWAFLAMILKSHFDKKDPEGQGKK